MMMLSKPFMKILKQLLMKPKRFDEYGRVILRSLEGILEWELHGKEITCHGKVKS